MLNVIVATIAKTTGTMIDVVELDPSPYGELYDVT